MRKEKQIEVGFISYNLIGNSKWTDFHNFYYEVLVYHRYDSYIANDKPDVLLGNIRLCCINGQFSYTYEFDSEEIKVSEESRFTLSTFRRSDNYLVMVFNKELKIVLPQLYVGGFSIVMDINNSHSSYEEYFYETQGITYRNMLKLFWDEFNFRTYRKAFKNLHALTPQKRILCSFNFLNYMITNNISIDAKMTELEISDFICDYIVQHFNSSIYPHKNEAMKNEFLLNGYDYRHMVDIADDVNFHLNSDFMFTQKNIIGVIFEDNRAVNSVSIVEGVYRSKPRLLFRKSYPKSVKTIVADF